MVRSLQPYSLPLTITVSHLFVVVKLPPCVVGRIFHTATGATMSNKPAPYDCEMSPVENPDNSRNTRAVSRSLTHSLVFRHRSSSTASWSATSVTCTAQRHIGSRPNWPSHATATATAMAKRARSSQSPASVQRAIAGGRLQQQQQLNAFP
jgi:hypothetical protein